MSSSTGMLSQEGWGERTKHQRSRGFWRTFGPIISLQPGKELSAAHGRSYMLWKAAGQRQVPAPMHFGWLTPFPCEIFGIISVSFLQ